MGKVCSVICASHTPFLYTSPEEWDAARVSRDAGGGIAGDVPVDSPEENKAKHARCMRAFDVLGEKLENAQPDVLIVFGDDQLEQFTLENFPAFCVFVGERLSGYRISEYFGLPTGQKREVRPKTAEHWVTLEGHPKLARSLTTALVAQKFDLSISTAAGRSGVGHAFTRPLQSLLPDRSVPLIPFYINCYYGPQPTGERCFELGRAIREVIESWPDDLRVGVIGSGGLWHTPMDPEARIDTAFDRGILEAVSSGDARRMAAVLDGQHPNVDPADLDGVMRASGGTGMLLGPGSGVGEVRNWIAASSVVDGVCGVVVDYVEINASPIGAGFAYWDVDP